MISFEADRPGSEAAWEDVELGLRRDYSRWKCVYNDLYWYTYGERLFRAAFTAYAAVHH